MDRYSIALGLKPETDSDIKEGQELSSLPIETAVPGDSEYIINRLCIALGIPIRHARDNIFRNLPFITNQINMGHQ